MKVVIIGAGMQGLSAGAHLAKSGATVTVVESEGHVLAGSSSKTASMLMMTRENVVKNAMATYSYYTFQSFDREFGEDCDFQRNGFTMLANAKMVDEVVEQAETRRLLGIRSEIIEGKDIWDFAPHSVGKDIVVAVHGPDDGHFDVAKIATAYETIIRSKGGQVIEGCRASDIVVENGRVVGVATTAGTFPCDWVINAAGSNAREVALWADDHLPIKNMRRSIFRYQPPVKVASNGPLVEDAEEQFYYRPDGKSIIFGLGRDDADSPDMSRGEQVAQWERARASARKRFPDLLAEHYDSCWSGFRHITPDYTPIVGYSKNVEGLIHSCGWGGEGVHLSPAGGRLVADLANELKTYFDLEKLSPYRFCE